MRADVDRILADRSRRIGRGAETASLAGAATLHVLVVAVAFLLPHLQPPPKPLEFVPVTVIPAQALGVRRPAPPRRSSPKPAEPAAENPPEEAASEPAEPAPPAPKAPEPKPEPPRAKPADDAPVLPSPKAPKPEPQKPEIKKPETGGKTAPDGKAAGKTPAPAPAAGKPAGKPGPESGGRGQGNPNSPPNATAVGETGDQAGRRGAPTGSPLGTTAFGSQIAGIDNPDFTYGYYLDRLLSLIDANWVRPSMGSGVRAIVSFRIQRDGSLSDLRISESSGYNSFDLAALRAVQNAAPFPPLPRPYKQDDLGVNLIVY